MIVERQKSYSKQNIVNGTPLIREDKTYKQLKEFKKETKIQQKEKTKNKKLSLMRNVATLFLIGMVLIVRYSIIYANQNEIKNIKNQISKLQYKNDDLKVQLLKLNEIKNIDEIARNKNKMVDPGITNTYYYDLSKDNFKKYEEDNEKEKNIVDKIKNIFFNGGK